MTGPLTETGLSESTVNSFIMKLGILYFILLIIPGLLFSLVEILNALRFIILFFIPLPGWLYLYDGGNNYYREYTTDMNAYGRYSIMLLLAFVLFLTIFLIKKYKNQKKHLFFVVILWVIFSASILSIYNGKYEYSLNIRKPLELNYLYTTDAGKIFYDDNPIIILDEDKKISFYKIQGSDKHGIGGTMFFINGDIYRNGIKLKGIRNPNAFTQLYDEIYKDNLLLYFIAYGNEPIAITGVKPSDFIGFDKEEELLVTKGGVYKLDYIQSLFKKIEGDIFIDTDGKVFILHKPESNFR